jgi:hypothetical protein
MSPIRDGEKFCKCFLADTMEEASELMAAFDRDITMLAARRLGTGGLDRVSEGQ